MSVVVHVLLQLVSGGNQLHHCVLGCHLQLSWVIFLGLICMPIYVHFEERASTVQAL